MILPLGVLLVVGFASHPPPKVYQYVQFLGWSINTFPGQAALGACEGQNVSETQQCYMGNSKDLEADVRKRVALMQEAIEKAYDEVQMLMDLFKMQGLPWTNEETLKVLVVPEFYFRGPYGAYNISSLFEEEDDNRGVLNTLGLELEKMVSDTKYTGWLFICGTVVGYKMHQAAEDTKYWDHWNFAPIYEGGLNGGKWLAVKKYISDLDYLKETDDEQMVATPYPPNMTDATVNNSGVPLSGKKWLAERGYKVVEDNMFNVSDIRIGIEICLDHEKAVLKTSLEKANLPNVQMQIVTSAGVKKIVRDNIMVAKNGILFQQDGGFNGWDTWNETAKKFDLMDGKIYDGLTQMIVKEESGRFTEEMAYMCTESHGTNWIKDLHGYYGWSNKMGCTAAMGLAALNPPGIKIYLPVEIAKP